MRMDNIFAEMGRNNLSILDLAKKMDTDRKTVSLWLNGKKEIPASKLVLLADIFNCTVDYLLNYSAGPPEKCS